MSYYKPYYKDNFGMLQELPLDASTLGGQPPSSYVKTNNIKTINGMSLLGTGDLAGFIKNNDNKPTESLSLQYSSISLYTKGYLSMISLTESSAYIGNSNSTKGSASITFSDGKVNIYAQNGVDINGTPLNDTIQNITEIAEGKTNSYVLKWFNNPSFKSNEDVIEINLKDNPILDYKGDTIPNTALKIGDIFYIIETNVPDRWLAGINRDVYMFAKMETSKVDLDGYATNTDVDNKIAAAIGKALEADY